jgi:glycosyltransferase involved in cell wall biosynthesis
LVSIVVRTKDRPKLLTRALQSISAQTYRSIEVVLVNDGGCDLDIEDFKGLLGDVSLNYIRLDENKGRARAGNVGIENSRGEYIGFLDDDDEFYPDHVETLVSCLIDVDYKIVYSDSELVYKEFYPVTGEFIETGKKPFISKDFSYEELLIENYIPLINVLFSRNVLETAGKFNDEFDLYEDWDLLIRCASNIPFYHVKKVTSKYVQWSKELQVAQSEMYRTKAALAFQNILERHRDKFTVNVIKYLIHFRSLNRDFINIIAEKSMLISKLEGTLEQYGADLNDKDMHIKNLENDLHDKDTHIRNLETDLHDKVTHIGNLEADLNDKDTHIGNLETDLHDKVTHIGNLETDFNDKDTHIRNLETDLHDKVTHIENLETDLHDKVTHI